MSTLDRPPRFTNEKKKDRREQGRRYDDPSKRFDARGTHNHVHAINLTFRFFLRSYTEASYPRVFLRFPTTNEKRRVRDCAHLATRKGRESRCELCRGFVV